MNHYSTFWYFRFIKKFSDFCLDKGAIISFKSWATAIALYRAIDRLRVSSDNSVTEHSAENTIVSDSAKNSFVLRASADSVEDFTNESDIAITYEDYGIDNFLGMSFEICGENISDVAVSVTGGSLSKVVKTISSEPLRYESEEKYIHYLTCTTDDKAAFFNYELTYAGSEITEKYDGNNKYGFCVSGERYEEITNSLGEVKKVHYACIDEFNDQILTVDVKYTDGTEEIKNYTLKTGRLKIDTGEERIVNGQAMKVLPEFTDDEETPWIYGVIASLVEE